MKKIAALILGCAVGLSACDLVEKNLTFEATPSLSVVITDTDAPAYDMRLSDIPENRFIILALLEEIGYDWVKTLNVSQITKTAFTVGQVVNGKFDKKMVKTNLSYWVESGSYWVAFFMADGKMSYADAGYISKTKVYISPKTRVINLTNLHFMGNIEMHIDIGDITSVPFN